MYRIALLLFLVSTFVSLAAQECSVSVPATIVDEANGRFVSGIKPGMLHAKIGQAVVPVQEAESIKSQRVIVLFDQSGSMDEMGPDLGHKRAAMQQIQTTFLTKIFPRFSLKLKSSLALFARKRRLETISAMIPRNCAKCWMR